MNAVLTHPLVCVGYAALLLDVFLLVRGKSIVAGIMAGTLIVVLVIHEVIRTTSPFLKFIKQALREDLGDIPKYYQSGGPGHEWASEFWVAEVESSTHPGSWNIAGCVGLSECPRSERFASLTHLQSNLMQNRRPTCVDCSFRIIIASVE